MTLARILKIIIAYYCLVVIFGLFEIFWGPLVADSYFGNTLQIYYFTIRLFLSLLVLAYWLRRKMKEMLLVLLFENISNAYMSLYGQILIIHGFFEMRTTQDYLSFYVKANGLNYFIFLGTFLASVLILLLLLRKWNDLLANLSFPGEAVKTDS